MWLQSEELYMVDICLLVVLIWFHRVYETAQVYCKWDLLFSPDLQCFPTPVKVWPLSEIRLVGVE